MIKKKIIWCQKLPFCVALTKKTKCLVCKKKYNSPFKISVKKASKKNSKKFQKKKVLSKSAFAYSKNISLSAFLVFQTISLPPYF